MCVLCVPFGPSARTNLRLCSFGHIWPHVFHGGSGRTISPLLGHFRGVTCRFVGEEKKGKKKEKTHISGVGFVIVFYYFASEIIIRSCCWFDSSWLVFLLVFWFRSLGSILLVPRSWFHGLGSLVLVTSSEYFQLIRAPSEQTRVRYCFFALANIISNQYTSPYISTNHLSNHLKPPPRPPPQTLRKRPSLGLSLMKRRINWTLFHYHRAAKTVIRQQVDEQRAPSMINDTIPTAMRLLSDAPRFCLILCAVRPPSRRSVIIYRQKHVEKEPNAPVAEKTSGRKGQKTENGRSFSNTLCSSFHQGTSYHLST